MRPTTRLHGIHAIVYALFDDAERIDHAAMQAQVRACLAAGVHGIAALGLATEVAKLREAEKCAVMDCVAQANAGAVPLAFAISGASVAEQRAQIRHAERAGADWVILQPPVAGSHGPAEYIAFFGQVAGETDLPVAIQNAPAYMGRGLTPDEIADLVTRHPNIRLLKGEGSAIDIRRVIEATRGQVPVFNGRGGLELTDNLRAGCAGFILAPDCVDHAVAIHDAFMRGDEAAAEAHYARVLPAITFIMQSLESLICYGKRIYGLRAGVDVFDRAPAQRPTSFGLELAQAHAARLGPFGRQRVAGEAARLARGR